MNAGIANVNQAIFPAGAGVNRTGCDKYELFKDFPRRRGGEPPGVEAIYAVPFIFPAGAGVNRNIF